MKSDHELSSEVAADLRLKAAQLRGYEQAEKTFAIQASGRFLLGGLLVSAIFLTIRNPCFDIPPYVAAMWAAINGLLFAFGGGR